MHKSIIQNLDVKRCWLCGKEGAIEAHHLLHGTANRKKADADGLIVNVCPECHRLIHDVADRDIDRELMQMAEVEWLNHNMATVEDFIARYGKNYI